MEERSETAKIGLSLAVDYMIDNYLLDKDMTVEEITEIIALFVMEALHDR